MEVATLFPPCSLEDCKKKGVHHHVLSHQQELIDSTEKFVALVGGFGSAKTLAACVLGHLLSVSVPGNIGIVCRRSLPKLHDSTERIYLEVLERSGVTYSLREMRDGWPHRVLYGNGSEVYFRETTDLGRFLGPEYGWFFVDEAQEEPERTFKDLTSRLRLPRAAKYLRGMIATNPPSQQHWIAKTWPMPGAWTTIISVRGGKKVTQSYRLIRSSTYDNPFLAHDYVASLVNAHSPSEARRVIEGFYGFIQEGDPVYPSFDFFKHVGDPPYRQMTLYRGWDFGFHCPAVVWAQIFRCRMNSIHCVVLNEFVWQNIDAETLANEVKIQTKQVFPDVNLAMVLDGGDHAGAAVNDKGPGPIIRLSQPPHNLSIHHRKIADVDPGIELIRRLLKTKCQCGHYLIMFHRRCRILIEAMAGGYHYARQRPGHEIRRKPVKDGYYDNVADAFRYLIELFYRNLDYGNRVLDPPGCVGGVDDFTTEQAQAYRWMGYR